MQIQLFQVDAFTDKLFGGNPAAVCPLDAWLDDITLQQIAAENNLAETAFFVHEGNNYHIRWFTPKAEVDLCGHATLATAFVLFSYLGCTEATIAFESRSGRLTVRKERDWLTLNFPLDQISKAGLTDDLLSCFQVKPREAWLGKMDYLLVFDTQPEVEAALPNLPAISKFDTRGVIITAKGDETDFVSRYFAPAYGINEDPVTGSAHTTLVAYWSKALDKTEFTARQLSERGGYLKCQLTGDRVEISGQVKPYLKGVIEID